MRKLTVLLDDSTDAWLRQQARRRETTLAEVIEELVRAAQAPAGEEPSAGPPGEPVAAAADPVEAGPDGAAAEEPASTPGTDEPMVAVSAAAEASTPPDQGVEEVPPLAGDPGAVPPGHAAAEEVAEPAATGPVSPEGRLVPSAADDDSADDVSSASAAGEPAAEVAAPAGSSPGEETPIAERPRTEPSWRRELPVTPRTERGEVAPAAAPAPRGGGERSGGRGRRDEAPQESGSAAEPERDARVAARTRRESEEAALPRPSLRGIPQHPVPTTAMTFAELGLSAPIVDTLSEIGFENPTPIQAAVIPPALAGRDVVGLAETGSGKTAAFVLPIAERLRHGHGVRALVVSPTREIALQTQAFVEILGRDHDLQAVCLIGGLALGPQADALRRGPDVLVVTPGRLVDHLERRNVRLSSIEHLVLDEADHMLDMGFMPQVQRILDHIPEKRQTLLFSATMPPPIERLAARFLVDPVRVDLTPVGRTASGISHRLYLVGLDDKKKCLLEILNQELGPTLVFIRRRSDAEWLTRQLLQEGHPVARIHSDLTQAQRLQSLAGFREGHHRILVATDIAARGIDVPGIRHVVNFDVPENVEDYIHRSGRTARGAAVGIVSTIATWLEKTMVAEIEAGIGQPLPRCTVPGVEPYTETKRRPTVRKRRFL